MPLFIRIYEHHSQKDAVVPMPCLPEAARCPDEQTNQTLRHLLALRGADVCPRAGRNRGFWKAGRARTESRRVNENRSTGATVPAELPRMQKVILGQSRIAGKELVQQQSVRLPLSGEGLSGSRPDR